MIYADACMQSIDFRKCRFHMLPPHQSVALVIPKQIAPIQRFNNHTTYMTTMYTSSEDTFPVLFATTSETLIDKNISQPLWTTVWSSYDIADMMGVPLVVLTNQYCDVKSKETSYDLHMYRNRRTSRFKSLSSLYKQKRSII